jgi:hypothetical protein
MVLFRVFPACPPGPEWKSEYGPVSVPMMGEKGFLADVAGEKGLYMPTLWFDDVKYHETRTSGAQT